MRNFCVQKKQKTTFRCGDNKVTIRKQFENNEKIDLVKEIYGSLQAKTFNYFFMDALTAGDKIGPFEASMFAHSLDINPLQITIANPCPRVHTIGAAKGLDMHLATVEEYFAHLSLSKQFRVVDMDDQASLANLVEKIKLVMPHIDPKGTTLFGTFSRRDKAFAEAHAVMAKINSVFAAGHLGPSFAKPEWLYCQPDCDRVMYTFGIYLKAASCANDLFHESPTRLLGYHIYDRQFAGITFEGRVTRVSFRKNGKEVTLEASFPGHKRDYNLLSQENHLSFVKKGNEKCNCVSVETPVCKRFEDGNYYHGRVVETPSHLTEMMYYKVEYEDGDLEDYSYEEVLAILSERGGKRQRL